MAKPRPKRTPEEEQRRRAYGEVQRAFKRVQLRYSSAVVAQAIKKDRGNVTSILKSHGDISHIKQSLNVYYRETAPKIWHDALKEIWLECGKQSIALSHAFFTSKGTAAYSNELDGAEFKDAEDADEWRPLPEYDFFNNDFTIKTFFGEVEQKDLTDVNDTWARNVDDYLRGSGGDHITGIADTTKDNVMGAIADGVAAGEPTRDIAARVEDQLDTTWPGRASTISRTEMAGATNSASLADAQATVPDLNKTWICSMLPNSRETHIDADGQSVPQSDPFEVGDSELMYPGDPDGDVEEIVNCMCSIGYEPPEDATAAEEGAAPELSDQQTSALADMFDTLASGSGELTHDEAATMSDGIDDILTPEEAAEEATPKPVTGRKPVVPPPEEEPEEVERE